MRLRKAARTLSRKLRAVLNDDQVTPHVNPNMVCYGEGVSITYTPRRLRIFDSIHVCVEGNDVWLPLLPRLLLRHAYRKYMANKALQNL